MRKLLFAAWLALPPAAGAHEVWIERDGAGPARIYLGEPALPVPEEGDPEFAKLKAPKLLGSGAGTPVRRAGFIEVAVPAGDVRAWDDDVFQPWGEEGRKQGVVYYARAGRTEPRAAMPMEIVPVTAHGTRFTLVRDGKPVPATALTVVSPDKWSKVLTTDAAGSVTVPVREPGRYLLSASVKDEGAHQLPGGAVTTIHRIATTTFVVR